MSRKDYIRLANALKSATPLASDGASAMQTWHRTVLAISATLSAENPRFDSARFVNACEGAS